MNQRLYVKLALLILCVSLVYLNSFYGIFQFDDYKIIVNYARAHSFVAWLSYFLHSIRPLLKLSYTLNWVTGAGLFGFHLFNFSVHAINTILIYFISLKFLSKKEYTPFINASFLASLLFGIFPLQTEAVTYISGRSISLMSMFYLGSIIFYIKGIETNRIILTYVLSPLFFILSVLARETAITLPLAILLWELSDREEYKFRNILKRQAVHWILLILIFYAIVSHLNYERLMEFSFKTRSIKENLLSQINGISYLLSRFFALNSLNIDPDLPVLFEWTIRLFFKAVFLLTLFIISIVSFRKNRWIFFGILWFFLHLIPTNSVVPRLDIANERHLYLPGWGIFLIISIGIEKIKIAFDRQRYLLNIWVMILLIIVGYFTFMRNQVYRSEIALWEDTVLKSPQKARPHNNLGYAYELEGRFREAKKEYLKALSLKPDYQLAKNNITRLLSHR